MDDPHCPQCGKPLPPGWNTICPYCGHQLPTVARPPRPEPAVPAAQGLSPSTTVPAWRIDTPRSTDTPRYWEPQASTNGEAAATPREPRLPPLFTGVCVFLATLYCMASLWQPVRAAPGPRSLSSLSGAAYCDPATDPHVGYFAPDFTLYNLDGDTIQLKSYRGSKPVWINFWQSTCRFCVREMPNIAQMTRQYAAKDIAILSVNVGQTPNDVQSFVSKNNYGWTFLLDDDHAVSDQYCIQSVPTNVFVDRSGAIDKIWLGGPSLTQMQAELDHLLAH